MTAAAAAVRARVAGLLATEFDLGTAPADDTSLADDLLLDSLAVVELVMVVEDELDIGVADAEVAELRTFGDLWRTAAARIAARDYGEVAPG